MGVAAGRPTTPSERLPGSGGFGRLTHPPPLIVSTVPVVYPDTGLARNATAFAISRGVAARPNGIPAASSRHRYASPNFAAASARRSITSRSVSTGPGLIATTRSPSAGAPLPSARVNAISDAFPAAPSI